MTNSKMYPIFIKEFRAAAARRAELKADQLGSGERAKNQMSSELS